MSILNKLNSAFEYKVYKVDDSSVNEVNCRRLLTEKQLSKMSRNEFRCYIKKYMQHKPNLDSNEIQLIKKIDRRIRNKETVRKLKMKTRNEFIVLKMEYDHLFYLYEKTLNENKDLVKHIESCSQNIQMDEINQNNQNDQINQINQMSHDIQKEKEDLEKLNYKYVDIEY